MTIYRNSEYLVSNANEIKDKLNQYGVAILENVLNKQEIDAMNKGMFNYLEHITQNFDVPITQDNEESWKQYSKLFPKHSMLLQQWQVGHAQFIWDLRQNEKVCDVFSKIWDVNKEDLLSSFDGASFHFPPEVLKRGYFRNEWFHTDQRLAKNDFDCIQSWITGYDVDEGDASLSFLEGSHKFHGDFSSDFNMKDHKDFKKDWFKINDKQVEYFIDKGCERRCVTCKAGSIVLWDSRLMHCGKEPLKNRKNKKFRNVVYICMMPRTMCSEANMRKRIKAFEELRMTNHYPYKPKLFGKYPQTYGQPLPNVVDINPPILNELGRKLVGY